MAPTIPSCTPKEIEAGSTIEWTRTFADFAPGDGFVPTYRFRGVGILNVTGTVGSSEYSFSATPAQTAQLAAGRYEFVVRMSNGTNVYTVEVGSVLVTPNLETAAAGDRQSLAEQMVELLEARVTGRLGAGADLEGYGVAGRNVQKIPFENLEASLRSWRMTLAMERNGGMLAPIEVRFG